MACDGKRDVSDLSASEGIFTMASRIHFRRDSGRGTKGYKLLTAISKYDSRGLEVEVSHPGQNYKSVMKYDDSGRETENLEYKDGKLTTATHSTYEVNAKWRLD